MNTIKELLQDADPLRYEAEIPQDRRNASRVAVIAAASEVAPEVAPHTFRIARLALIVVCVLGIVILGSRLLQRAGSATHHAARFELRMAEETPGPGLREAQVSGSGRSIFLSDKIIIRNRDIVSARVSLDDNARPAVSFHFTPEGAEKIRAATRDRIGKPMAILIEDVVVMAPPLMSHLGKGDSVIVSGVSKEQAERIVNGIK